MIYTSKTTPIISACSRLVWAASHQPQVMEIVERLHLIDDAVKRSVMADAPPLRFKDLAIRSGYIDGIINAAGNKLLYVAVSYDDEPTDAHLLHVQRQLADLNARKETHLHMQEAFMLIVNKSAGRFRERVMPYRDEFAIDFQFIADEPLPGPEVVNSECNLCPLRYDCETLAASDAKGVHRDF
ncbi:putative CRISPR-associated exonuclease [Enterobacter phage ST22]|nr:putative CRISPR-associated exonuclease [Enterobacter phage ST22]